MRATPALLFLLLGALLAGCSAAPVTEDAGLATLPPDAVSELDGAGQRSREAAASDVATLHAGQVLRWEGACPCPVARFVLGEDAGEGWLEVRVRWDGQAVPDLGLSVLDADGGLHAGIRGFDARRAQVWGASPGEILVAMAGVGDFQAEAQLRQRVPADGQHPLPDLTTTVPVDVHVGDCDPWETVEQGATRCLRLGNGVANPGHGPLQVYLSIEEGAQALALEGHFVQQVLQADGSWAPHEVGAAHFHPTHGHWHYDGLARFSLHEVLPGGLRGAEVAAHEKAGFCFLDWGQMPENETEPGQGGYAESNCLYPANTQGWSNGVSAGWYDFYESGLSDQYVDIEGLPDGVYEFVSRADPSGGLLEADTTNNAASVVVEVKGSSANVLEERGWYRVGSDDV